MPVNNSIITAPVTMQDVQVTIGNSSNDLATLCTASTINKWSRKKPVRHTNYFASGIPVASQWWSGIPYADFGSLEIVGIFNIPVYAYPERIMEAMIHNEVTWEYIKSTGGKYSYRLGDFDGYNHVALPLIKNITATGLETNLATFEIQFNNLSATESANQTNVIRPLDIVLGKAADFISLGYCFFGVMLERIETNDLVTIVSSSTRLSDSESRPLNSRGVYVEIPTALLKGFYYNVYPFFVSEPISVFPGDSGNVIETIKKWIPVHEGISPLNVFIGIETSAINISFLRGDDSPAYAQYHKDYDMIMFDNNIIKNNGSETITINTLTVGIIFRTSKWGDAMQEPYERKHTIKHTDNRDLPIIIPPNGYGGYDAFYAVGIENVLRPVTGGIHLEFEIDYYRAYIEIITDKGAKYYSEVNIVVI